MGKVIKYEKRKNNVLIKKDHHGEIVFPNDPRIIKFDLDDFDLISSRFWSINDSGYAITYTGAREENNKQAIRMHRLLMEAKKREKVDHKYGVILDNRKEKLRIATSRENTMNRTTLPANNTSGAMGVYWNKRKELWEVKLNTKPKSVFLGYYGDFNDAVEARKTAEKEYFKAFAPDEEMCRIEQSKYWREVRCRKRVITSDKKRQKLEELYGVGFDNDVDYDYEKELLEYRNCG